MSSRPNLIQACGSRACQVCFGLAQFRGWGGLLQFQTLFSNFNLHIRRAQGIPLSTYPAMRKRENATKIAAISLSQTKFTISLHSNFPVNPLRAFCLTFRTVNAITLYQLVYLWPKAGTRLICETGLVSYFIHRFHASLACTDGKSIWTCLSIGSERLPPISNKYWHTLWSL